MASLVFVSSLLPRNHREWLLLGVLVTLVVTPAFLLARRAAAASVPNASLAIKVDQAGYPLHGPKVAMVAITQFAKDFRVRRSVDNKVVLKGKLGKAAPDANTGDVIQAADFSQLSQPGTYYIEVPGVGRSWDFAVEQNVYEPAYKLAMLGFYGQRCGTAVDLGPEFPGYKHPACHLHGEFHPSSGLTGTRDNIGGWHDAGDYGRYVVNSGISTATLLWAWELFPAHLKDIRLHIPESGNGTPDLLNEARWNLEWVLKMQDVDGGAWQKQTSTSFPGFVSPEKDDTVSEIIGTGSAPYKSTAATADLAALMAVAARVYRPYDAAFAARALDAARRAWAWTERNPDVVFANPAGVSTGEYGDKNCADERLWAAAELWRTTGEAAYNTYFVAHYAPFLETLDSPPSEDWAQVAPMGLWSYALANRPGSDPKAVQAIRARAVSAAHAIVERTRSNAYHSSMKTTDYVWGSNGLAANYGKFLLIANELARDPAFVDAARDNLHYLLGRNTFSLSWVTQLGQNAYQHPHHRPSGSGEQPGPWPGLLSGGPNAGRQDPALAALPKDLPPAKVYVDQLASYASNEIAINWQAALVFLLTGELH